MQLAGGVYDQNGAAISNALVRFAGPGDRYFEYRATTDQDGRFVLEIPSGDRGTLMVEAAGFQKYRAPASATDGEVKIVLSPAGLNESVTITRSETRVDETSASVVVVDRQKLDTTAAATLDDRLRQVPGFSLFRRAGSRTANPTTQGVSLRGVGASGASRALVLADGVPLNDPFGGWIYWGRIPAESISQVEILRGASGDLYGNSAIGGVISVLTRRPAPDPFASIETSYGTQRTPFASGYASIAASDWSGSIAGEFFQTAGFIPVDEAQRGSVDTRANVRRSVIAPFVERSFKNKDRIFGTVEFFRESRENGTRLQTNDTDLETLTGGIDWELTSHDFVTLRVNGGSQNYDQTFSAVSPDRNSESLNRLQHVPSKFFGLSGQWTGNHREIVLFAGADFRGVRGHSDETGFLAGSATSKLDAGGREFTTGIFAGVIAPLATRLTIGGGFRVDWWRNLDGFSRSTTLSSGAVTQTDFPDRAESAFSPRLSALYRLTDNVAIAATFSTGFRRPTLNELYRNFRVGDIVTLANANLEAERARSFDTSAIVDTFDRRLYVRAGIFCTTISDNVSNVTLSVSPVLTIRQRQNVGRTRACGFEADGNFRITNDLRISGGYLFVDSRVTSFPANTLLEGLFIPQIARHQFSMQVAYTAVKQTTLGAQIRAASSQFDDDLNQFRLNSFATTDVFASRRMGSKVEIFAAAENLFDSKIEAGRTPALTVAAPRTFRLGLRLRLGRN